MTKILYILLLLCAVGTTMAQTKQPIPRKSYTTRALGNTPAPVIDGSLSDEAWNTVEWTGDFIENLPEENTLPIEQTKFKVLYDNEFIYFGFKCYDKNPKEIVKRLSRRDGFEGDWIEVNISSHNDKLTAFSFAASVAGVKSDGFISENGTAWEGNWNPIWYLKTNIDEEGWTAEFKIPLSELRFSNAPDQVWGLQSTRRYFRTEERSLWQRIPLDAPGWVSEFGELRGIKGIVPKREVELRPFLVSKMENYPAEPGNPFKTGRNYDLNAGLDAKVGVTNDLTLNLTINPDFGQVEADPATLVLDGFQVFYPEQRPFFIESRNIFNYTFSDSQDNLFYSRRIGRTPQGWVSSGENSFVAMPDNTAILGAAKFSGKTKSGWSIGVLESVTSREYAKINQAGNEHKELVEPLTNYFVGRVQKDFNNRNSYLGGMFTSTLRNIQSANLDFLHTSAISSGMDFMHNWKNRKYYIRGNLLMSYVEGSKQAILATQQSMTHLFQRFDAKNVEVNPERTSLTGTGGRLVIGKASDGNWRYRAGVTWVSPELELNDVGFLRQANNIRQEAFASYVTLKPFGQFRSVEVYLDQIADYDFDGNHNNLQFLLGTNATLKSNWTFGLQALYKPVNYSISALQGGPRVRNSEEFFKSFSFTSDSRKKFRYNGAVYSNKGKNNSLSYNEFNFGLVYQPVNAFTVSVIPSYALNKNKAQYVTQNQLADGSRYIMASLDQKTISAAIRFDCNINPDLTIQYYGQPFISQGKYVAFGKVANPTARNFEDRSSLFTKDQISADLINNAYLVDENIDGNPDYTIYNPNFSSVQFRSNLVVRWEYIPGSELYLVWSQGLSSYGRPENDLLDGLSTEILNGKPQNTFLLKATYRLSKHVKHKHL
ncbi:hydrolase [Solitalea longa]|uniref:Hydrolase n=1 Tax=Solitalea longa TaxID=2079460 RepID=A0A2S5A3V6_9SPHI|nr:DUF5916 domain-containing protein [Solitalea longa]POY37216.1 hydrolase [Solitalea longa]